MDLEIKDRFEERRDGIVCAGMVWEDDSVSTRTSVRIPREIDLELLGVNPDPLRGLVGPSATVGRLVDRAKRTAALALRRAGDAGNPLPPAAEWTAEWLRAASDLIDEATYTWGAHNAPQHWPEHTEVLITEGGAVHLGDGTTHAGTALDELRAGTIVGYRGDRERQSLHAITLRADGMLVEDGNAVIVRTRGGYRHPVIDHGFDDAWYEHTVNWFQGAIEAERIERRGSAVVYREG